VRKEYLNSDMDIIVDSGLEPYPFQNENSSCSIKKSKKKCGRSVGSSQCTCDFEVNQTNIKGGCQSGRKVVPTMDLDPNISLTMDSFNFIKINFLYINVERVPMSVH